MTRDHLAQKVASVRQEELQGEWPKHIIGIVRLLLSCLHAWGADRDLDRDLEGRVGLIQPIRPISFGLASRGGVLSLVLPGWVSRRSAATPPASPQSSKVSLTTPLSRLSFVDLASIQDQRWGLSQLLTTQHLLTVVSVANTLMNYIRGAQLLALAASRPVRDSLSEDSEEEDTSDEGTRVGGACRGGSCIVSDHPSPFQDNMIRASWSQVTALHCVMLPERQGRHFRAPNLQVLAEHYPDKCVEVRADGTAQPVIGLLFVCVVCVCVCVCSGAGGSPGHPPVRAAKGGIGWKAAAGPVLVVQAALLSTHNCKDTLC